jgi:hypothetical protein
MELESLEYKIVMEDERDAERLGWLAHLDMATAAYMAPIARYPERNIACATEPTSSNATTAYKKARPKLRQLRMRQEEGSPLRLRANCGHCVPKRRPI